MFNEDEDWNDEQDIQVLIKTLPRNIQQTKSSTNIKVQSQLLWLVIDQYHLLWL